MKISARNVLKGTVKVLRMGMVSAEVILELPGRQEIVSVITRSSAERLNLSPGATVYAVVKSTDVLLMID